MSDKRVDSFADIVTIALIWNEKKYAQTSNQKKHTSNDRTMK